MMSTVKWWRANPSTFLFLNSVPSWFDPTKVYPGVGLTQPTKKESARLFCDLEAFQKENAALSMVVPLAWLDELKPPP